MGNVGNRVADKRVDVGLDRSSLRELGSGELERDLGDRVGVVREGCGGSQSHRGSHGHHSRGLKSSDSCRLHCLVWWWLLAECKSCGLMLRRRTEDALYIRQTRPVWVHGLS